MQLVYRVVMQWDITLQLYIALFSTSLNPTLHISRRSSVGNAFGLLSKGCWSEPIVRHYFSSSNFRLLAYTSLQVKTPNQNEWSVMNNIENTVLRQDSYLYFICRLFLSQKSSFQINQSVDHRTDLPIYQETLILYLPRNFFYSNMIKHFVNLPGEFWEITTKCAWSRG